MITRTFTGTLSGFGAEVIGVEIHLSNGLPFFNIVGLTDTIIKESTARIRSAIVNSGFKFPMCRITVNLSPADMKKQGSHFDLPIAVGILGATGVIKEDSTDKYAFFGELTLDGKVKGVAGILPLVMCAEEKSITEVVVPYENRTEAAMLQKAKIFPSTSLEDIVKHLNEEEKIEAFQETVNEGQCEKPERDFSQIYGQENIKRAMIIAAAGGHNMIMMGSPGVGKTMMAKRFVNILPPMTYEEMLEATKIYSIAGLLNAKNPMINKRPYRQPASNTTKTALVGGGRIPKPGEVSLAHKGVLFLDEFANFGSDCIEALRQPLEDKKVDICRIKERVEFPADEIVIIATNPCKCGYKGDDKHMCTCSPKDTSSFMKKMSGPLLDRIDMHVRMTSVEFESLKSTEKGLATVDMRKMVLEAREYQKKRYSGKDIELNAHLYEEQLEKYCKLGINEAKLIEKAYDKLGLSVRTYNKILKISRTIADIEKSENISVTHIAEAIQYRGFDELYRGEI